MAEGTEVESEESGSDSVEASGIAASLSCHLYSWKLAVLSLSRLVFCYLIKFSTFSRGAK